MSPLRLDRESLRRAAPFAAPLLCLAVSILLKVLAYSNGPLWLDEGWTLAIVQQHGAAFLRQLGYDPNPPLYYLTLKAWTLVGGLSDGALRTPSVLAAIVGPLFALAPGTGLDRRERWLWMALLALWTPGVFFAQEARNYALLFAMECAAAAAFLRLLTRPRMEEALLWCGAQALCLLTHQHALILAGLQGAALLVLLRGALLRLWPAALLFVPPLAWMITHAPRLAQFARPEFAWYPPMTPQQGVDAVGYAFGGQILLLIVGSLALTSALLRRLDSGRHAAARPRAVLWAPAVCALLAVLIVVAAGFLRPSFAFRYLIPYGPGLTLGMALLLKAAAPDRASGLGLAAMAAALAVGVLFAFEPAQGLRRSLQYETASKDLMAARARHVAFLWDNPTNRALTVEQRLALARTFFDRAGYAVDVAPLVTGPADDPAPLLYGRLQAVGDGFVWLYDRRVPGTAATLHPPWPSPLRLDLACATYTEDAAAMGVLACRRRPLAPHPASPPAAATPK